MNGKMSLKKVNYGMPGNYCTKSYLKRYYKQWDYVSKRTVLSTAIGTFLYL
jgi:hypothetical protein